jgi:crossover junction endodeoxyribonuclease RusA
VPGVAPQTPAEASLKANGSPPAGTTGRAFTIALPPGLKLLSLNDRLHWRDRNSRAQELKRAAWVMALNAKVPPLGRIAVIVEYRPPDRRRRDAENICAASGKAAIDGIVAAGVLPDDECPRYVSKIVCTIGEPAPKGQIVLYLIEVTAVGADAG